jgi:poly(3-hydroxybutyrate) depolymerase
MPPIRPHRRHRAGVGTVLLGDSLEADPTCAPTHPILVINSHGDADLSVPYSGKLDWETCINSTLCPPESVQANIPYLPNWARAWGDLNGCATHVADVPVPSATMPSSGQETFLTTYSGCNGGVEVLHYMTHNGPHDWPSRSPNKDNTQNGAAPAVLGTMEATEAIYDFFTRFTRVP